MLPLCVDLDGTLVKTDTLWESVLLLLKQNPLNIFWCFIWLLQGKAQLKAKLAQQATPNPECLPYHSEFLDYLQQQHAAGRPIYLVTAADYKIARAIADHLKIFTDVIASDGQRNLRGTAKRQVLNEKFGRGKYEYAGNETNDLHVWRDTAGALVVSNDQALLQRCQQVAPITATFAAAELSIKTFLRAIRVHQFSKNILIFAPLIVGHQFFNPAPFLNCLLGFLAFSLLATVVYLSNDLLDLEADRKHRSKRFRPLAAGEMSIPTAIISIIIFLFASLFIIRLLPTSFVIVIAGYFTITLAYSWYIKKRLLLDVFTLAILYTMRVLAGMTLIDSPYSPWLISFSLFLFLSLAFVKRYSELYFANVENKTEIPGRSYLTTDLPQLGIFGIVSGYLSVLVFALYINSNKIPSLYQHPQLLWLVCLLLLYWLTRIWLLAYRGQIHEDPVLFAVKDKTSFLILGAAFLLIVMSAF